MEFQLFKLEPKSFKRVNSAPPARHCAPTPIPPLWSPASASTRRQSRPTTASALLSSWMPQSFPFCSPLSFLGARSSSSGQNRVKPPPLVAPAVPRHPAPCFSRQSLPRLAPHSRCTAPTPIRPLFGPNRTPRPSSVVAAHRSSAPLDELLPPAILRPKSIPGEFPRGLLMLFDLIPTRIGAAAPARLCRREPPL